MTGDRQLANERYYTACKCCLNIFTKIKLLVINRQLSWCFLLLLYFLSLISAFVMSLIEAFARLFISLRVLSESSKACYFSTVLALLLLTMV